MVEEEDDDVDVEEENGSQDWEAHFARASTVEMHVGRVQEPFCMECRMRPATTSVKHRALTPTVSTPSVWPHCLGKKLWKPQPRTLGNTKIKTQYFHLGAGSSEGPAPTLSALVRTTLLAPRAVSRLNENPSKMLLWKRFKRFSLEHPAGNLQNTRLMISFYTQSFIIQRVAPDSELRPRRPSSHRSWWTPANTAEKTHQETNQKDTWNYINTGKNTRRQKKELQKTKCI